MRAMRLATSLVCFVLVGGFAVAQADSWPRFRGPTNTDHSPDAGLLKEWPDSGPERLWLFEDAGYGYSGFSVQGGRLYTMGTRDDSTILLCLDAESGEEVWATEVGAILSNGWGDGPRSTPTVDGEHVYTVGGLGGILCVEAATGAKVWSSEMSDFGGDVPRWGYSESLLVDGDQVICTPGGSEGAVVALNKKTGEMVWQCEDFTGKAEYSSTVVAELHGVRQYVRLLQTTLGGIDSKTGELLWSADWPGRTAVCPTPIVNGNQVYVTSGYNVGSMLVEVGADGETKKLWQNKVMNNHHGGVVRVGDHLYGHADRGWVCQSWEDGSEVWLDRSLRKGAIHYADGMLYCVEERSGAVALVEASAAGYREASRFTLSPQSEIRSRRGRIWVHPVVIGGRLFLRDQEYVYCYDVKSSE